MNAIEHIPDTAAVPGFLSNYTISNYTDLTNFAISSMCWIASMHAYIGRHSYEPLREDIAFKEMFAVVGKKRFLFQADLNTELYSLGKMIIIIANIACHTASLYQCKASTRNL